MANCPAVHPETDARCLFTEGHKFAYSQTEDIGHHDHGNPALGVFWNDPPTAPEEPGEEPLRSGFETTREFMTFTMTKKLWLDFLNNPKIPMDAEVVLEANGMGHYATASWVE